jgi:hypothetical protein
MMEALYAFENYLHSNGDTPVLVKAALSHAQFETIHPFLDGNESSEGIGGDDSRSSYGASLTPPTKLPTPPKDLSASRLHRTLVIRVEECPFPITRRACVSSMPRQESNLEPSD